jgi:hypothetical protein
MSTKEQNSPSYIQNANFIDGKEPVDEDLWPRNTTYYNKTKAWQERLDTLKPVITQEHVDNTVEDGKLYNSIKNSVTFARGVHGVAIYVIVSATLREYNGSYPTNPSTHDYNFNAVSVWVYVYEEDMADLSPKWSDENIKFIKKFCSDQSL